MHKRTNPFLFVILALVVFGAPSCTESFSEKMESAKHYLKEIGADNVVVGTAAETKDGQSMVMTTLKYSGLDEPSKELDFEWKANKLAWDYYTSLPEKYFKGETHLMITFVTKSDAEFQYVFPLTDLYNIEQFQKVADAMVQACLDSDTAKISELKDSGYLPDDQMGSIYYAIAYNDSLYAGQKAKFNPLGFRLANGAQFENLKLYAVTYECRTDQWRTGYKVNVDRDTKKVVYLELERPKER